MSKMNKVVYFVEGECEEKMINALKQEPSAICPGKVKKINVIQNVLSTSQLIQIQTGTIVVLVFDTDVPQTDCLKKNLKLLEKKCTQVKTVCLAQVLNLEDELVRCTDVAHIEDLTHSRSRRDFKRNFCATTNTRNLLEQHQINVAGCGQQLLRKNSVFLIQPQQRSSCKDEKSTDGFLTKEVRYLCFLLLFRTDPALVF